MATYELGCGLVCLVVQWTGITDAVVIFKFWAISTCFVPPLVECLKDKLLPVSAVKCFLPLLILSPDCSHYVPKRGRDHSLSNAYHVIGIHD